MKAVQPHGLVGAKVLDIAIQSQRTRDVLLKVRLVGMCGTDLNTYLGRKAMVTFTCVIGHKVSATVKSHTASRGRVTDVEPFAIFDYGGIGLETIALRLLRCQYHSNRLTPGQARNRAQGWSSTLGQYNNRVSPYTYTGDHAEVRSGCRHRSAIGLPKYLPVSHRGSSVS